MGILEYLKDLVRETKKSEAEVLALAVESGLRQMHRDVVLGRYLRGEISREEAVRTVGADAVELAERQARAVADDVKWALKK